MVCAVAGVRTVANKDSELRQALNDLQECSVFEAREMAFKTMDIAITRIETLTERLNGLESKING